MAKNIELPSGIIAEVAEYKYQEIEEYRNNPFIEALPPIMDKIEAIDKISVYPPFSEDERFLKSHLRYHIIQRLFSFFQPLSIHLELESKISRLLRQGYLARNPYNPNYIRSINKQRKSLYNNVEINCNENFRSTASSFTIVGTSGVGKTTSLNRVLSALPQVIVHNNYKGNNLSLYQLVWIKLDCPFDGSTKGLCLDFFSKIDSVLGTSYYAKYSSARVSTNGMIPAITAIARQCSIGMIILDELQHLSMARSGGANKVLNFIVTLINTGIPVIAIGTPKSLPLLQGEFRQARRSEGVGGMFWDRLKKDESFELLLEGLWDYQWIKKPSQLTKEYIDVIYEESLGITDIVVKLFIMSQIRAISSGKEEISSSLIKKVAEENLKFIRPMLNDLRSGSISKIAKYDDIMDINIEGFMSNELNKIDVSNKIKELKELKKQSSASVKSQIKEQAILKLIDLDIDEKVAVKSVERYVQDESKEVSVNGIVKGILKALNTKEKDKIKEQVSITDREDDLRVIVKNGKGSGISAYNSIKKYGYIKNIDTITV
ncbi:MAG: ATP-binding protein [Clostridiaceae bacterium]|nr:ATP-binding protein [Clostridiaceae bacterium]